MSTQNHVERQRRGVNVIFLLLISLLGLFWLATALDLLLGLSWGWDRQVLWAAPLMALFAFFVRLVCFAIFKFVDRNY